MLLERIFPLMTRKLHRVAQLRRVEGGDARISGDKISGDWFKIAKHKTKSPCSFGVQASLRAT